MVNKFAVFLTTIIILGVIHTNIPVSAQRQCNFSSYMIDANGNCIRLDSLPSGIPQNQPSNSEKVNPQQNVDNNSGNNNDQQKLVTNPEKLEINYKIKEKETRIEFLQKEIEQYQQQISNSCAQLSKLDQRLFCNKQKTELNGMIAKNQESIKLLEKEIETLSQEAKNLPD